MPKKYFVTGIGTGVGKTLVSALLCEYLKADYFKPVQTGYPPDRDSRWVQENVSYTIKIHPEKYLLQLPASPHLAAKKENITIDLDTIKLPDTSNALVMEGAGGLLVPLNDRYYIADMIRKLNAECILVVSNYLGCINHSLLSLYYILNEQLPFKGVVLNGNFEDEVKAAIIQHLSDNQLIAEIPFFETMHLNSFQNLFKLFQSHLKVNL